MASARVSAASASLERRAFSLGTANAIDYGLQFLLPMVLTRTLDPHSFGEYRLLWLAVATLMAITPMVMPESLYYFLPRSDRTRQRLFVNQTMIYLVFAGIVSGWALSVWNPFLPGAVEALVAGQGPVVPAFVLLWVFAYMLDVLPTAEERVGWQAKVIVSLSAVRAVALSLAAIATRELAPVLWVLLAFAALKAAILLHYVAKHHGLQGPWGERAAFKAQVKQAAPFALSGALHGLRSQADQWIVAAMFSMAQFAAFSVAAVLGPMVHIFRSSVNHVFLPTMSRLQSAGDHAGMIRLNARANAMVALLVFPLLAFAFVFAEQVITLVYTSKYLDAVPVMRLYVVGLLAFVVELVSILFVLGQGGFAARINATVLLIAVPVSFLGATQWGLTGAALGSIAAVYTERVLSLLRISRLTDTPVSRLQDWGKLAALLAASAVAAAIAAGILQFTQWSAFFTLAAGGALLALVYPATLVAFGQKGELVDLISSLRNRAARS